MVVDLRHDPAGRDPLAPQPGLADLAALVEQTRGSDHLKDRQAKTELNRINSDLKRLKREIAALEERKSKLLAALEERAR